MLTALLAGCHGNSDATTITVQPSQARLVGSGVYVDRDGDQRVGAGDSVTVRFDRPMTVRSEQPVAFQLSVAGDSFGSGARMERGDQDDEVRIVLGSGAALRTRGSFAQSTAGSPSGIQTVATDAIVGRDQQETVAVEPARDLIAGLLMQAAPVGDIEGIVAGDLDGDGDLDLIAGRAGAAATVLVNNGAFTFVELAQRLSGGRALALGDLDGDGDLDLVIGSDDVQTIVWLNYGNATFVKGQDLTPANTEAVALGDLDGDGDLDLVRGNGPSDPDDIWWNDGTGRFTAGPTVGAGNTHAVTLADVDGDGDLDLLQGRSGPSQIWNNDGHGVFTEGQGIGSGNTRSIAVGDLDCDGDLDLVIGGHDPSEVWRKGANGVFRPTGGLANAATEAVRLLDVDGDGRLEVFAANSNGQDDELWVTDGDLALRQSGLRFSNGTTTDAVVGDFDRDGDVDVITVGPGEPMRVLVNSSSASRGELAFQPGDSHLGDGAAQQLAVADLDRDGAADVVQTMGTARATGVWRNDGTGRFPQGTLLAGGGFGVATADVDRDGDIDVVETGPSAGVRLWRNDGTGLGNGTELTATGGVRLCLGDLDRDGDLDLLLARATAGPAGLWWNDGRGTFTRATVPLLPSGANDVAVADVDRDGDLDLLFATDAGVVLLRNGGGGSFPSAIALGTVALQVIATGDVDGDGRIDLAVGGDGGHAIWRSDGAGGFTVVPLAGAETRALLFADLDADSDLDLLRGGAGRDELWRNDGGTFVLSPVELSAGPTNDFAAADLDCDGDLDVLVADGSSAGGLRVYVQR